LHNTLLSLKVALSTSTADLQAVDTIRAPAGEWQLVEIFGAGEVDNTFNMTEWLISSFFDLATAINADLFPCLRMTESCCRKI